MQQGIQHAGKVFTLHVKSQKVVSAKPWLRALHHIPRVHQLCCAEAPSIHFGQRCRPSICVPSDAPGEAARNDQVPMHTTDNVHRLLVGIQSGSVDQCHIYIILTTAGQRSNTACFCCLCSYMRYVPCVLVRCMADIIAQEAAQIYLYIPEALTAQCVHS